MGKTIIKEGSPVLKLFIWVSLFLLCEGSPLGGQNLPSPISLSPDRSSQVRNLALNRAAYHSSCSGFDYTAHLVTDGNIHTQGDTVFSSRWESARGGNQWVYIDLGTICRINQVKLFWGREFARSYQIQFSADKHNWRPLYSTKNGKGGVEDISLPTATARYVRLYMTDGEFDRYTLTEI